MKILERTGNKFRCLSWKEYRAEREKDGDFSCGEKMHFNRVKEYCKNAKKAKSFSPNWSQKS